MNVDFSIHARLHGRLPEKFVPLVFTGHRLDYYRALDEVVVHDLRKGIPYQDGTVDGVYHSHVLEHIDRDHVPGFLREIHRVLRPGGVHRIVVPDLEQLVRRYVQSLELANSDHDHAVGRIIGQAVMREAGGTSLQRPLRRKIENLLLGDARKRGETHQWMWDRINLANELAKADFRSGKVLSYDHSQIHDWCGIGLDRKPDGTEYKPGSLYMEVLAAK